MMKLLHAAVFGIVLILGTHTARAQTFDTAARAAFVYDQTTGTVLLAKNADESLPPASMSKLMTVYMAFEAIADGRLTPDETLPVSQHSMDYGGSTMFLRAGERVKVEDLLRGIIILSGNDASSVIAESLSPDGTEATFARMMTERARELGMPNSSFANSNGWPDPGQRMSMRDLVTLANRLITDYPTFYPMFSEQEFLFDGRAPANSQNRNPLLGLGIGADGLKTGHTSEAGYGLVGSAKRGDRRIIFALTGMESSGQRSEEAQRVVDWAFRQFARREIAPANTRLAEADVWMGSAPRVGLTVKEDLALLVPVLGEDQLSAEAVYTGPIPAPIKQGEEIAKLRISAPGMPETLLPLYAAEDVDEAGVFRRIQLSAGIALDQVLPHSEEADDNSATEPQALEEAES